MSGFDWKQYLDLAVELFGDQPVSSDEAKYRTVISRAYCAALMAAREYLASPSWGLGYPVDHARASDEMRSGHDLIMERLKREGRVREERRLLEIAKLLEELRRKRASADYDTPYKNGQVSLEDEAAYCLREAEEVIEKIDTLKEGLNQPRQPEGEEVG